MIKRLLLFMLLLCLPSAIKAQGYALQNFGAGTAGNAPANSDLANSNFGSLGSGTSWTHTYNGAGSITYAVPAGSCASLPPNSGTQAMAYNTTAGSGTANEIFFNLPSSTYVEAIATGWMCYNGNATDTFSNTVDFFNVFSGTGGGTAQMWVGDVNGNTVCNLTSPSIAFGNAFWYGSGTSVQLGLEGGTLCNVSVGTWYQVSVIHHTAAGAFLAYFYFGDGNTATMPAGHQFYLMHVKMTYIGESSTQFPIKESPVPAWDGILTPGRGIDWTLTGIPGGIPDTGWSQCGSTVAAYTGNASTINTAMTGCGANTYVKLGAGTFNINAGQITFPVGGNIALRGSGSNSTFLVFSGSAGASCGNVQALVCAKPTTTWPQTTSTNWTAGYTLGGNQITVASTSGITAGQMVALTQCDTGYVPCQSISSVSESGSTATYISALNPSVGATVIILGVSDSAYNTPCTVLGSPAPSSTQFSCTMGFSGHASSTGGTAGIGCAIDNSNFFNAGDVYATAGCNNPNGASRVGADNGNILPLSGALQLTMVTGIAGSVLTISPPLVLPNIVSGQTPRVYPLGASIIQNFGLEFMSLDASGVTTSVGVQFIDAYQFWMKGVIIKQANTWGLNCISCLQGNIESNYIYGTGTAAGGNANPYGIRFGSIGSSHNRIENNILQQNITSYSQDGSSSGNIFGYNVCLASFSPGNSFMNPCANQHAENVFDLFESNYMNSMTSDDVHGTTFGITDFRDLLRGWDSQPSTPIDSGAQAVQHYWGGRYSATFANVIGTPGYQNVTGQYSAGTSCPGSSHGSIYYLGLSCNRNPQLPANLPYDSIVVSSGQRYGNYDTVTVANRFCGNALNTNFASAGNCNSVSEADASGASTYPGFVPVVGDTAAGQAAFPASFYLSTRPSWYKASVAFPAIGPDITGGNLKICSGTINTASQMAGMGATLGSQCPVSGTVSTAWNSEANAIPALACYLTNGGTPDGTGSIITFDANTCYYNAAPGPAGNSTVSPGVKFNPGVKCCAWKRE